MKQEASESLAICAVTGEEVGNSIKGGLLSHDINGIESGCASKPRVRSRSSDISPLNGMLSIHLNWTETM